jgi:adenylosuccinate lyase
MDDFIFDHLGEICGSLHKIATDIRLAQHDDELYEPFEEKQVGSSAMPYKQNPIRCERICSLARDVILLKGVNLAGDQWFERTLNDSAFRGIEMKKALILTDYIIALMCNIIDGLTLNHHVIDQNIKKALKYIVAENLMAKMCEEGMARDEAHRKIEDFMLAMKEEDLGEVSDLTTAERIDRDLSFKDLRDRTEGMMIPNLYIGMCQKQVKGFIEEV